jgi:Na+/proline symporter
MGIEARAQCFHPPTIRIHAPDACGRGTILFGAAFGSLILLSLTWPRTKGAGSLAGTITGAATVMIWIAMGWNSSFLGGPRPPVL